MADRSSMQANFFHPDSGANSSPSMPTDEAFIRVSDHIPARTSAALDSTTPTTEPPSHLSSQDFVHKGAGEGRTSSNVALAGHENHLSKNVSGQHTAHSAPSSSEKEPGEKVYQPEGILAGYTTDLDTSFAGQGGKFREGSHVNDRSAVSGHRPDTVHGPADDAKDAKAREAAAHPKASIGEKIKGQASIVYGKATHNAEMVEKGHAYKSGEALPDGQKAGPAHY